MHSDRRGADWQGYLAAGLAGVFLASAVLLPLGRSRLRAEQERTEAAEREAAEARAELRAVDETLRKVTADSFRELKKSAMKLLDDEPDPQRRQELLEWIQRMGEHKK
jgi:hypothetical protein